MSREETRPTAAVFVEGLVQNVQAQWSPYMEHHCGRLAAAKEAFLSALQGLIRADGVYSRTAIQDAAGLLGLDASRLGAGVVAGVVAALETREALDCWLTDSVRASAVTLARGAFDELERRWKDENIDGWAFADVALRLADATQKGNFRISGLSPSFSEPWGELFLYLGALYCLPVAGDEVARLAKDWLAGLHRGRNPHAQMDGPERSGALHDWVRKSGQ